MAKKKQAKDEGFDENDALAEINLMWLGLGRAFKAKALEGVMDARGPGPIRHAKAAEVCFWRATGSSDSLGLDDL